MDAHASWFSLCCSSALPHTLLALSASHLRATFSTFHRCEASAQAVTDSRRTLTSLIAATGGTLAPQSLHGRIRVYQLRQVIICHRVVNSPLCNGLPMLRILLENG